jgi:hypothetical protein
MPVAASGRKIYADGSVVSEFRAPRPVSGGTKENRIFRRNSARLYAGGAVLGRQDILSALQRRAWARAAGRLLQAQINYTHGALRYIFQTPNSNWGKVNGADEGFGVLSDAVYGGNIITGNASDLSLTTAWNINAGYDHFWNPRWRTSLYGGYAAVSYGDQGNRLLCALEGAANGAGTPRRSLFRVAITI